MIGTSKSHQPPLAKGLALLAVFIILLTVYALRWAFFKPFVYPYLRDLYDHSQWRISQSPRGIGDSELYQVAGYSLVLGDSPFNINPEMPPLGKYFYGLSARLLGNPYLVNIPLYLLTVAVFYQLTALVFTDQNQRRLAVVALLLNPLFFSQLSRTMLDLPQLFFLLLYTLSVLKINRAGKIRLKALKTVGAGFSFGALVATKIGVLAPIILLAGAWVLR